MEKPCYGGCILNCRAEEMNFFCFAFNFQLKWRLLFYGTHRRSPVPSIFFMERPADDLLLPFERGNLLIKFHS